ncbi:rho guanine nucleotide exchange factor 11 [Tachyglossus aculeatus]|uniref:rho guanine nucleotide exchange factor 11 n=1 Tax=Tachyglossus aculeatus TaxID=9261 RepID=UPI0018F3A1F8|nr:rho guanine nucleotide exchange factor 11 [Tachyglossus aculeatus]
MSVRPPQTIDRLSGLSSLSEPTTRDGGPPAPQRLPTTPAETPGLVQRCVVVQRDQHGFGFTVSGDRVVLVQSVRPGGAALKAGVKEGDRIIKVNGTMVTNSSHVEVVKLIKSGAYVALTLLGSSPASGGSSGPRQDPGPLGTPRSPPAESPPPPPPLPPPPPPERITGPRPLQDPEVQKHATQILFSMLRQEEQELQRYCAVYSHRPARLLEEQIEGARRRVSQLQLKIRQETGSVGEAPRSHSDGNRAHHGSSEGRHSLDSQDGDSGLESGPERLPSGNESLPSWKSVFLDPGPDSPRTSPVVAARGAQRHRRQGSEPPPGPDPEQGSDGSPRPLIIGPEEDYDPGYFNNECDALFQDLEKLKARPAHLGVFLRYIFAQADPSPLLFYLCAEVFQQTSPKDSRNLGKIIWNVFLEKNAPLRVKVPEVVLAEVDLRLRNNEDVRGAMSEAQAAALPEIQEQIQDYRRKRTMGLGNLYGENDLLDLDGDPLRERELAEKQLVALGDLVSRYEEERSVAMDFALSTYVNHAGLRGKEARSSGPADKTPSAPDREKWLPFFPKAKKSSNSKKERDALEDRKRNPILKYIGKPKGSSQSTFHVPLSPVEVKPGNVRTMIQHFENSQNYGAPAAAGPPGQRLSTGSFPEDLLPGDTCRSEVKLGRSESLKGREELKRSRKAENVPRSRSDVDMDAAAEAARLHQSTSSSASSLSARSLENPTPPYTPKMGRRSIESPSLGFPGDSLLPHLREDDPGQLSDLEPEPDAQNWRHTAGRDVVAGLSQREIDRQEVINELFVTEASHVRTLRVLDVVFYQPMRRDNLLAPQELTCLFPNLPDVIDIHNSWCEAMKKLRESGPVVKEVGDLMLARFDGEGREELQEAAARFCSQQSIALEIIKAKQRKESRFQLFMQEAESLPQCRRLQLRDLIVAEMQRLTKYPLLLDSILKHTDDSGPEREKLGRARDRCREILRFVNEAVKQAENRHRLEGYQRRLDTTSLERASNPLAAEFKSLDLTSRKMIHEGPLSWRISKDKTVDVLAVLLEDLLVLLQRQQDEKLLLKVHSKTALGSADSGRQSFSPVLKLNAVLVRSVATDKRAFFIICTSELGPPQIYELVAQTSLERNTWMELLEATVQRATRNPAPHSATADPPKRGSLQEPAARRPPPPDSPGRPDGDPSPGVGPGDATPDIGAPWRAKSLEKAEVEAEGASGAAAEGEEAAASGGPGATAVTLEGGGGGGLRLPLPEPLFPDGLADSALEDVESLRHLILLTLLAGPGTEPVTPGTEDPLTPPGPGHAASTRGGPGDWRGEEEAAAGGPGRGPLSSLGQLPPRTRNSGIWESPELDGDLDGGEEPAAGPPDDSPEGYQVVRKAAAAGGSGARRCPASVPSEAEPRGAGGGVQAAGNCFYISAPAGPRDPDAEAPGPGDPEVGSPPGPDPHPDRATGTAQGGIDPIFQTIQQLTVKLHQLKELEMAHHELLRSLGAESSGATTPVGGLDPEPAGWADRPPSPPGRDAAPDPHLKTPSSEDVGASPEFTRFPVGPAPVPGTVSHRTGNGIVLMLPRRPFGGDVRGHRGSHGPQVTLERTPPEAWVPSP